MKKIFAAMMDAGFGVLCTVLEKSGSAPRGPGAQMAVLPGGRTEGTIGGGMLEYEAIQTAKGILETKEDQTRDFVLDNARASDLGMICGGRVKVEFRYLEGSSLEEAVRTAEKTSRIYVFGGGHVAQALVPVLAGLDFAVTVMEERPQFADRALFPGAEQVLLGDFQQIENTVSVTAEDYVVVMTRGHQSDYDILRQILWKHPQYVGCIGSRRKAALTRERLLADGFSTEAVEKIHSPIGLNIGAETPAEIAISIAAELIQCRRGENL